MGFDPADGRSPTLMHVEQERDPWARVADRFVGDHYKTIRGRVRAHVIDQHLKAHLPSPPASIVDVGGGGGTQALPLARRGYDVTIVDSSPAMLEQAADALSAESEEVASRVQLVEAKGEQAFEALGGVTFEGVLCHGVLPYVDDPEPLIASLCVLCAEDGIVSIVAKNQTTLAVQPALEGRWSEALSAFDATQQVNRLGFDTRADTVEDLTLLLERNGVRSVAWYGVRLFTDGWIDPEPDDLEDVLAVELEASRREPYRAFSRLFHLIGEKSSKPELINPPPG
jgi:S-adenosylmethionine-dependent methyltransferase